MNNERKQICRLTLEDYVYTIMIPEYNPAKAYVNKHRVIQIINTEKYNRVNLIFKGRVMDGNSEYITSSWREEEFVYKGKRFYLNEEDAKKELSKLKNTMLETLQENSLN